jgi:hypothetical protein
MLAFSIIKRGGRMARTQIHLSLVSWAVGLTAALQSSYSMSTLGLGTAYQNQPLVPNAAWIDAQDRVWSNLTYYEGKKLVAIWGGGSGLFPIGWQYQDTFTTYPVRHTGTGATVAATKLSSKRGNVFVVSPNGQRAYLTPMGVLTPVSPSPAVTVEAGGEVLAMQDSGAYTGRIAKADASLPVEVALSHFPALWGPGQPRQDLPVPTGFRGGVGRALNTRNEVAGAVFTSPNLVPQAAVWRQGQLTVLDGAADQGSFATGLSELGHVLVVGYRYTLVPGNTSTPSYQATRGPSSYTVFYNGQRLSLSCPAALSHALASAISPSGLVVGQCSANLGDTYVSTEFPPATLQPNPPTEVQGQGQAWIWKDGVGTELASYLTARGVKLPAGLVLRHVLAVNAKGSMVVLTLNASGQPGLVKFNALN